MAKSRGKRQQQQDWVGLGAAVRERREDLDYTQDAVYAAGGPSTVTQRTLETGRATGLHWRTVNKYEKVLRWRPGSFAALLEGEPATVLDDAEADDGVPIGDDAADRPIGDQPTGPVPPEIRSAVDALRGLRSILGADVFDAAVDELYASIGQPNQRGHTERVGRRG